MDAETAGRIQRYAEIIAEQLPEDAAEGRMALAGLIGITAELDDQATTDSLTELPNRRALLQKDFSDRRADDAAREVTDEFRESSPVLPHAWAGVYIDLDRFKKVNDVLGHRYGDRVLIVVSSVLRQGIRKQDEIYRVGGDEFMLYLPLQASFDPEEVGSWIKDRFDEGIAKVCSSDDRSTLPGGMVLGGEDIAALQTVSASYGVYLSEGPSVDRNSMLDTAEAAMRVAKDARNER